MKYAEAAEKLATYRKQIDEIRQKMRETRAAAQQKFAANRSWKFPMVSHEGTPFAADMGYRSIAGGWQPGGAGDWTPKLRYG